MKKIYRIGISCVIGGMILAGAYGYRCHRIQAGISERILRFHVIANSDDKKDQDLKLKVRDKIGSYLGKKLSGAADLEECEQAVTENLNEITDCAREVIAEEGCDYPVKAFISDTDFPEKTYGSYTFPKGRYHALRVVIGDGAGKNWWCVMYPNLCFAGSVYGVTDETSNEELRTVLTEEEYEEIMAKGKIRVKFKYLDKLMKLFGME